MNTALLICTLSLSLLLGGCGQGMVDIDEAAVFKPKIGVFGILIPGQPANNFVITRNFPVNTNLQTTNIVLNNARVTLSDLEQNISIDLQFDPQSNSYRDVAAAITIRHGASYTLEVAATFNGEDLETRATTTVPAAGFHITSVSEDSLRYLQRNANNDGDLLFNIRFERSPGVDYYLSTTLALDAAVETYVYDNPYEELTEQEVLDDLDNLRFEYDWIQNAPLTPGSSDIDLFWIAMPFYGRYQVVLFAADRNYRHFLQTFNDVQEEDGNFHAPVFYFEGDGIGVFGSAIPDTTYLTVLP